MEWLKSVLYVVMTLIMGVIIFIAPTVAESVAVFYVSLLTGYLGLDVWAMIQKTAEMPKGEFTQCKKWRYVLCVVGYSILILCGYIKEIGGSVDFEQMYSVFLSAVFLIVSIFIGGLEGNKIATSVASS